MSHFGKLFRSAKPVIGVIHLPPLPGFRGSPGLAGVIEKALADLRALEQGGVDGVLVENEHDRPHEVEASRATLAAMTRVARDVVMAAQHVTVGVEILLNDPGASLAAAAMAGARFIRTDYFVDRMTRPEYGGEMRIDPEALMTLRRRIGADEVRIFADVQVKYARMIEPRPIEESAALARQHLADAIVITGDATGMAPSPEDLTRVRKGALASPILIGSGLTAANAPRLWPLTDGAIVGSSLKEGEFVDRSRVAELVGIIRALDPATR